jgi:hypothetical protein
LPDCVTLKFLRSAASGLLWALYCEGNSGIRFTESGLKTERAQVACQESELEEAL